VPTYDYRCRACGHTIEIMHSILEDGPEASERCRGPVERVLHPAGVIFKGSGFYTTDSRPSAKAGTSESSPASGSSTSGDPSGTDSKT
jgi:putative FmdB family regulatory protein